MDALLLAGGFGTRLRPLTYTRPKPLIPVGGRPMLEWALDRLPPEVDHVVVAVNWLADKLEEYFAASERDLRFSVVRESEPLGTAGAVQNCAEHLQSDAFFVLNGDIISHIDMDGMLRQHERTQAVGTIALKEVAPEEVVNYGVVQLDADDPLRIRGFVEKPATPELAPSRLINAGAYLLDHSVLERIPKGRLVSMEKEIFPQLLDPGFYGHTFDGLWIDVGDPARILQASRLLGHAAFVDPSTHNEGEVEHSMVGARGHIGAGAHVMDSVIGDRVRIDAGLRIHDCIIGDDEHVTADQDGARIWSRPLPEGYPDKQVGNTLPGTV